LYPVCLASIDECYSVLGYSMVSFLGNKIRFQLSDSLLQVLKLVCMFDVAICGLMLLHLYHEYSLDYNFLNRKQQGKPCCGIIKIYNYNYFVDCCFGFMLHLPYCLFAFVYSFKCMYLIPVI
jgi:hypothetical protein